MSKFILLFIRFYQRFLSAHKGYKCAYGAYYQGDSCSVVVSKIIKCKGIVQGYSDIKKQFSECAIASSNLQSKNKEQKNCFKEQCCELPGCLSGIKELVN